VGAIVLKSFKLSLMSTTFPNIRSMSPLLLVADLDQSMAFYAEHLGFTIDFRYEDFYAGMVKGSFTIHFKCGKPDPAEREDRRKNEDLDLVFAVSAIGELYDAMKRGPVQIVQPLREMPYGTEFYISDPDGYIISFIE
jgi:catechol 2,3-dioxygenase-like lactoylglutathione lyase family enzyme